MQRMLDNVINLRQYILRYTVANSKSLRCVAFHWLTSEYMQLVSGYMQLAAAGGRRIIVHFTVFLNYFLKKKNDNSALEWG